MKRKRCILILCFLAVSLVLTCVPALAAEAGGADAPEYQILVPSEQETTITPGRDFYVIGTGDMEGKTVKIELFPSGAAQAVRTLESADTYRLSTDAATPPLDSVYGVDENFDMDSLCFPDISYDPAVAGSAEDPSVKIAVSRYNFAALILGGETRIGLTESGKKLTEGKYLLRVTISAEDAADIVLERSLTMAVTQDKLLSRFSPSGHLANVTAYSQTQGWRVYLDPLPGYWSPSSFILDNSGNAISSSVFLENLSRWRTADGMEYESGRVHMILYNVSATSASQSVEVAAVQRTNRIDRDLYCYYYNIGEPTLLLSDAAGGTQAGQLTALPQGDKLALTRVDYGSDLGDSGTFSCWEVPDAAADTNPADGVTVSAGNEMAICGVTAPIQNTAGELVSIGNAGYSVSNLISDITYTISTSEGAVCTGSFPVGLTRELEEDWNSTALYEFRGVIDAALTPAAYTVSLSASDSNGKAVSGTEETFLLTVTDAEAAEPDAPAVIPAIPPTETWYTVKRGDCLWSIARQFYDSGQAYTVIYEANDTIKNPARIYVGQRLLIPAI